MSKFDQKRYFNFCENVIKIVNVMKNRLNQKHTRPNIFRKTFCIKPVVFDLLMKISKNEKKFHYEFQNFQIFIDRRIFIIVK